MLISPASAAHFTPASEGSGGAVALSIILGVAVVFLVIYIGYKRWRRRGQVGDDHGDRGQR